MIKAAQPNPGELNKLEHLSATPASVAGFAKSGKLQAQSVEYVGP
jgi:hypothetical protein